MRTLDPDNERHRIVIQRDREYREAYGGEYTRTGRTSLFPSSLPLFLSSGGLTTSRGGRVADVKTLLEKDMRMEEVKVYEHVALCGWRKGDDEMRVRNSWICRQYCLLVRFLPFPFLFLFQRGFLGGERVLTLERRCEGVVV